MKFKKEEINELEIPREVWRNGRYEDCQMIKFSNGEMKRTEITYLLNPENNMRCCLGILGKHCGIEDGKLKFEYYPSQVYDNYLDPDKLWLKKLFDELKSSIFSYPDITPRYHVECLLTEINDDSFLSDEERELKIADAFLTHLDVKVKFTGKYPEIL